MSPKMKMKGRGYPGALLHDFMAPGVWRCAWLV